MELEVKRLDLKKSLDAFWAIDEQLQPYRQQGLERFGTGFGKVWQGIKADDPMGDILNTHAAAKKQLRVDIARRKDVGNLNKDEQEAAAQMIPDTYFDSPNTANLKNAWLRQLTSIEEGDINAVRETVQKFMKSGLYKKSKKTIGDFTDGEKQMNFSSEDEVKRANLPKGTRITINEKPAIWE